MPRPTASARTAHWLWPLLLLLGCVTATIAWMLVALATGHQSGWMALFSAAEIVWMLRLGTLQAGRLRIVVALLATTAVVIAANWGIAAAQIGGSFGLDPLASAVRLGTSFAWTLSILANTGFDLFCTAAALVLAAWLSR